MKKTVAPQGTYLQSFDEVGKAVSEEIGEPQTDIRTTVNYYKDILFCSFTWKEVEVT